MNRDSLPKIPFGLEVKAAYWATPNRQWIQLLAETKESIFLFRWDGVSPYVNEVSLYSKVEFDI